MTPNQSRYPASPPFTVDRQAPTTSWPTLPQNGDARFNKPEFVGVTYDDAEFSVTLSNWASDFSGPSILAGSDAGWRGMTSPAVSSHIHRM